MTDEELIRRVAVEVMGWNKDPLIHQHNIWNPLVDLNVAFMVVEKMREEGWDFKASIRQGSLWCVLFEQYPALSPYIDVFHDNLGHAICLAALKAKEAQK